MTARRFATRHSGLFLTAFAAVLTVAPALAQQPAELPPWRERSLSFTGSYLASIVAGGDRDTEAAAGFLGRALARDPNDPILIDRTFLTRLADADVAGALPLGRRLAQADQPNPFVSLTLAVESIKTGDFAEAEAQLNSLSPDNPVSAVTKTLLSAWVEQGLGNTDEAIDTIKGMSGPDWYPLFANYQSGLIASFAGRHDEAIEDFRAAYTIDGSVTRMAESFIRELANAGQMDEARSILTAETTQGNHPVLEAVAADIEAGRMPALPVASIAGGAAEVLYTLGSAIGTDAEELATVYLSLALHLDPSSDYAAVALADMFQSLRRFDKATEAFGAISPDSPFAPAAQVQRAIGLDALDRTDEAVAELEAIIAVNPNDGNANVTLADILSGRDRFAEATPYYTRAIELRGELALNDWRLFFRRGISYERTGEWDLAEPDFFKALELSPEQPQVLNYLGYTWADMGINLDRALEMIQTAVDLRPNDGYIVDSLGWAYYQLGRYEDAVAQLERAVQLSPEDPTLNDHLGDAYWQVGRKREAVFQWNHARDLDPEPDDLALIMDKIANGLTADAGRRDG